MKFVLLLSFIFLGACTSLQSVSTSSVPAQRGQVVKAQSDRFIILGLNFNNDYVNTIVQDLARQCPNGRVEGILTKQESINYFLYLLWTSKISATGYCVGTTVAGNAKARKPGSEDSSSGATE